LGACRLVGSSHSWSASASYPAKAASCDQGFELLHDTAPASRSTLGANCAPHVEAPGTKAASHASAWRPNASSAWACATAPFVVTSSCAMMDMGEFGQACERCPPAHLRLTQR
jgi:hypothetical protein